MKSVFMALVYVGVLAMLTGCAEVQTPRRYDVRINHAVVKVIVFADVDTLTANCHPTELDDGTVPLPGQRYNGCWHRLTGQLWMRDDRPHDLSRLLRHELCHAITDLSNGECHRIYPPPVPVNYDIGRLTQ